MKLETQLSLKKKKNKPKPKTTHNFDALGFRERRHRHRLQCGGNLRVRRTWTAALGLSLRLSSFSCEPALPAPLTRARTLLPPPPSFQSSSFLGCLARKRREIRIVRWFRLLRSEGAFTFPFRSLPRTSPELLWWEVGRFKEKYVLACHVYLTIGVVKCLGCSLFLPQTKKLDATFQILFDPAHTFLMLNAQIGNSKIQLSISNY